MPYQYLSDIAIADVAFRAWGNTLEKMFVSAADASMNVMVEDLAGIMKREHRDFSLKAESIEMLLFELLQELIFFKDAEQLLLRVPQVFIQQKSTHYTLKAEAYGEMLDPKKHELNADVKAVTLHHFQVVKTGHGWEATVILDI
jgi:SHS2 domain-containing protein